MKFPIGIDALNLAARRLKTEGLTGSARRYWRKRRYRRAGLPTYVVIEPASTCNLRCPFCAARQSTMDVESGIMKLDNYKQVIDSLTSVKNYYPPLDLVYRGEPLINPHFAEMAAYAAQRGLIVGTNTNATLLRPKMRAALLDSGLSFMIVSFDGAHKQSFEEHRVGADFDDVVDKLKAFIHERDQRGQRKPLVDVQFIVTRKNEAEIPDMKRLTAELGMDRLSLKTIKLALDDASPEEAVKIGQEFLPVDPTYRRYAEVKDDQGRVVGYQPATVRATCDWGHAAAIRYNGDVAACCADYTEGRPIGNVFETNFWDLWWSEPYVEFRRAVLNRRLPICKGCD